MAGNESAEVFYPELGVTGKVIFGKDAIMQGKGTTAGCLAALLALLMPVIAQGQRAAQPSHPQQYSHAPAPQPHSPNQRPPNQRPPNQPGHAGNWLRNYRNMSPEQQHRALQNDPQFRRLPPQRQMQLQNQLHRFNSMPPQQQDRVLNRMETWEHLTPGQRDQARQMFQQFRQLPPNRRQEVNRAIRDMRNLSPDERDRLINSDRFRQDFSPSERNVLNGAAHLPLAPGGLQGGPE